MASGTFHPHAGAPPTPLQPLRVDLTAAAMLARCSAWMWKGPGTWSRQCPQCHRSPPSTRGPARCWAQRQRRGDWARMPRARQRVVGTTTDYKNTGALSISFANGDSQSLPLVAEMLHSRQEVKPRRLNFGNVHLQSPKSCSWSCPVPPTSTSRG
ncbi:hypothetical protein VaNZ11_004312, partial [Volvox africanus]